MAQAPPILIYSPGGGVSSPIGSNPPVYSQAGTTALIEGQEYLDVVFGSIQTNDEWVLVDCEVVNETDVDPLNLWPGIITDRTEAGFRIYFNGLPDSGNYYLHWAVSGVNIAASPASTYYLTGPSSVTGDEAATYTVSLPPSTYVDAPVTVTPSEGGLEIGVISPETVTLTTDSPSQTFTFTPALYGDTTITVNNDRNFTDPADLALSVVGPTIILTGPSTGESGSASTDFTVELSGAAIGTVTVTPDDAGDGGTFTPTDVALTTLAPSDTFTYTPASAGTKTITVNNDSGLDTADGLPYIATPPPFDPTTITGLKLWFKADSLALADGAAVSTWSDSSGNANHATQSGSLRPIYKTNIVNGKPVVRFDGVDDYMALGTEITTPTNEYTVVVVYKTTGDNCFLGGASNTDQQLRVGQGAANILSMNVSGGVGSGAASSSTLHVARSAWNLGCARLHTVGAGTVDFFDKDGYLSSGAGGITLTSKVGAIGVVGIPPIALYVSGDIAEIIFYSNTITDPDVTNLGAYLTDKYGL